MSQLDDYIYKKCLGFPEVLPYHLRNYKGTGKVKLHTDWPPIANKIPRSWNARGPRAKIGSGGYLNWPPILAEGFDVTRWENSGATSILWFPDMAEKGVTHKSFYGKTHRVVEMNPGNPKFRQDFKIDLPLWRPALVTEVFHGDQAKPDFVETIVTPNDYSPSALQKFSMGKGYMKLEPRYELKWKILKKREWPFEANGVDGKMTPDGEDLVFMLRDYCRPDHLDVYYNTDPLPIPAQIALHWE